MGVGDLPPPDRCCHRGAARSGRAAVRKSTPRAVAKPVAKPPVKAAVSAARPPVAAVVAAPVIAQPAGPVSRDLVRLPLAAAQRFAAQIGGGGTVTGTNPVSRLLDFAALASSGD